MPTGLLPVAARAALELGIAFWVQARPLRGVFHPRCTASKEPATPERAQEPTCSPGCRSHAYTKNGVEKHGSVSILSTM